MKRVINPWMNHEGYHCYGCDPNHEHGLRMEFYEDGDEIVSLWTPTSEHQSWINTLHGGIQAALLDELCGWVVFRKFQTGAVTSKIELRYRKPIKTDAGQLTLRARVAEQRRNLVTIVAEIYNSNGELCTECSSLFFLFSREKAAAEMGLTECLVEGE